MAHENKTEMEKLGKEDLKTFSQVGGYYEIAKFTPKKCLNPKKKVASERMGL